MSLNKVKRLITQSRREKAQTAFVDLGYRGVDKGNLGLNIKHRDQVKKLTDEEKKLPKRLQEIEPDIAHLKADHLMSRCHLKGSNNDSLLAVLFAAGFSIRWLLRMISKKGIRRTTTFSEMCN